MYTLQKGCTYEIKNIAKKKTLRKKNEKFVWDSSLIKETDFVSEAIQL